MKQTEIENLNYTIDLCNRRIEDFLKEEGFDPFTALTGKESKAQRIYGEDVNFLCEIQDLMDKHSCNVKSIIFGWEVEK